TSTGEVADGRPDFQDIRVTKAIDSTSPLLYMRIAQGTVIPTVEFKFLKDAALYYTIELTDAVITGVVPSMGSAVSTEMLSFAFKRIQWTITSGGVTSGWDVTTNTPL
ncbi:MAG: type VI secretion system tube protein Hcp, partial [Proteobacteria bacterium]|nr:type VI secretion system tube protein Hcp [Pseudomonadota bacterium]